MSPCAILTRLTFAHCCQIYVSYKSDEFLLYVVSEETNSILRVSIHVFCTGSKSFYMLCASFFFRFFTQLYDESRGERGRSMKWKGKRREEKLKFDASERRCRISTFQQTFTKAQTCLHTYNYIAYTKIIRNKTQRETLKVYSCKARQDIYAKNLNEENISLLGLIFTNFPMIMAILCAFSVSDT